MSIVSIDFAVIAYVEIAFCQLFVKNLIVKEAFEIFIPNRGWNLEGFPRVIHDFIKKEEDMLYLNSTVLILRSIYKCKDFYSTI